MPVVATHARKDSVDSLHRLAPGQRCAGEIAARERWVPTVFVEPGEEYVLSATGSWFDRTYACGPEGHRSRSRLMRLLKRFRRVPHAKWMALVGSVGRDDDAPVVIGAGRLVRTRRRGVLLCYANHLRGMNSRCRGRVMLSIERIR